MLPACPRNGQVTAGGGRKGLARAWHAERRQAANWLRGVPRCHQYNQTVHQVDALDPAEATAQLHPQWQQRTALLLGAPSLAKLQSARVLVVGLGGVGSFAVEFLARAGIGSLTIVDGDVVDLSNTNRQLPAAHSTVGMSKVRVMAARLKDIAPSLVLNAKEEFILPETADELLAHGAMGQDGTMGGFDWVVDAIDSLEPKKLLIRCARAAGINIISSMGAGGRLDPSRVKVVPLSSTFNDPFAMNIRKNLRKRGVDLRQVPCVWSEEPVSPSSLQLSTVITKFKRSYHGTISYLPAQFGLLAAAHVINSLVDGPMAAGYRALPTETWGSKIKREVAERRAQKQRDLLAQAQKHRVEQAKAQLPKPARDTHAHKRGSSRQAASVNKHEQDTIALHPTQMYLSPTQLRDDSAPLIGSGCEPNDTGGGQTSFLTWALQESEFADIGADI